MLSNPFMDEFLAVSAKETLPTDAPAGVHQVHAGVCALGLDKKVRFFSVESDYYNWTLEERMLRLKSPSIHHLCKSLIFINNKHKLTNDNELDPTNSKYYCVITQYSEKLSTQKLLNGIRSLRNPQLPKTKFNPRIAPEDKSFELTGFINNAVSPIGMKEAALPIIISEAITKLDPPLFYLGAGDVDWKIAVPTRDFVAATNCFVIDISSSDNTSNNTENNNN